MSDARVYLFVEETLLAGLSVTLTDAQAHYVKDVMRCKEGEGVQLFNGRDGKWLARIAAVHKREVVLLVEKQLQTFKPSPDLWLLFAPVKNEKIDFLVKRSVELGVSRVQPVMTKHTMVNRVNVERLQANAVEAAQQCERHDVPEVMEPLSLIALLSTWPSERTLLYGDESGHGQTARGLLPTLAPGKYAVLIGPEGGFAQEEHALLQTLPFAKGLCLGPRVLRAETAVLAALTCVQVWLGDWNEKPRFESAS